MDKNPWHVDPWEAARKHYDKRMQEFMARVMMACGVTQIELDPRDLLSGDTVIEQRTTADGKVFFRVVGHLSASPSTTTERK